MSVGISVIAIELKQINNVKEQKTQLRKDELKRLK